MMSDTDTDTSASIDSGFDTSGDTASGVGDEVAVLSRNLHCFKLDGTSFASNHDRFAAVANAVETEGSAAIAVQEACQNEGEGVSMDRLASALLSATGETWGTSWTFTHTAWTGTSDEAEEGVGLLIRGQDPADVETLAYAVQGTQDRTAVAGTFATASGADLRLYTVHIDHDDADARRMQTRETAIHALVHADSDWVVLVAGDFNASASEDSMVDLDGAGIARLSVDSDTDGAQIDHVLAPDPANFEVLESRLMFDGSTEPVALDDGHGDAIRGHL